MTDDDRTAALAEALCRGQLPADADPVALAAAVQQLADEAARGRGLQALRPACTVLNKRRFFEHTRSLAPAGGDDLVLQRLHAQAEINLSALDEGERLVQAALARAAQAPAGDAVAQREAHELRGLLGRVAKQRFADGAGLEHLDEAVRRYLEAMARAPAGGAFWPAVNALALLHRREREGLAAWPDLALDKLAADVKRQTQGQLRRTPGNFWLFSTLSECCLAQDRADDAELWLYRFMLHPEVDPFGLDSFDRQLREIWGGLQGRNETLADRLETLMARHLLAQQSRWTIAPQAVAAMRRQLADNPEGFEKNFSGEGTLTLETLEQLLRCCAAIGCVANDRGERLGTGFLMRGADLNPAWGEAPVFVTNAHVISTEVDKAIPPERVRVSFEVESAQAGEPRSYRVAELLHHSPPGRLGEQRARAELHDVTVVRLQQLPAAPPVLQRAARLPLLEATTKAFVVGHPRGSGLQISLHDSQLLDICREKRLLHYRTPTEPGSSGSPVFNANWQVVALHHGGSAKMPRLAGEGTYAANEGIALDAICSVF